MMNKTTYLKVLILFCTHLSFGAFSQFVHITPENKTADIINFRMKPSGGDSYSIYFPWESRSKQCWIIVFKEDQVPKSQRDYREYIWNKDHEKDLVEYLKPLRKNQYDMVKINKLSKGVMKRSFIVIDFPKPTLDGGNYYTIDLPEFLIAAENNF